ncbi:MAG: hypothetical protein KDC26_00195 [Armatimonadetes bacterium]|nr:hypothetical protein [Armatimonadota bacterium]
MSPKTLITIGTRLLGVYFLIRGGLAVFPTIALLIDFGFDRELVNPTIIGVMLLILGGVFLLLLGHIFAFSLPADEKLEIDVNKDGLFLVGLRLSGVVGMTNAIFQLLDSLFVRYKMDIGFTEYNWGAIRANRYSLCLEVALWLAIFLLAPKIVRLFSDRKTQINQDI